MPEVRAGVRGQIVIRKAAADVDGDRRIRHAVIHRGRVRIPVEVDSVLLEQVRPHQHADVGQREEHLIVLIECNQGRRDVAVHHAHIHDLPRIHMAVDHRRSRYGRGRRFENLGQPGICNGKGVCEVVGGRKTVVGHAIGDRVDGGGEHDVNGSNRKLAVISVECLCTRSAGGCGGHRVRACSADVHYLTHLHAERSVRLNNYRVSGPRRALGDIVDGDQVGYIGYNSHRAVISKTGGREGITRPGARHNPIRRGRIAGKQNRSGTPGVGGIRHIVGFGILCAGQTVGDVGESGQRPKRKHERLGPVGHRRITVAA